MAKMSDPQIGAASARNVAFESTFTRGRILSEVVGSGQARFIVDVGAYTGETAEWFCELFPHATVVAIEPYPIPSPYSRRSQRRRIESSLFVLQLQIPMEQSHFIRTQLPTPMVSMQSTQRV